ncbi:VOC family protein [Nitrosomonas mobilis]|uniref:Glyoxalase/Bleomycin resistance protein/dioxygenase domain protein n=1 Tax=Nitrosomonas mobilis TaxID=51642 RepID=A0A1G5SE68_9PROT|nr:VOC family protein [Nitrosomonas mobilis]SCZ84719.1 Glyoxalase/Bleomycin resistance protein/dioxygenase domain protein [Nitrosomonas mobilis]
MSTSNHGNPCWYELATSKGNLEPATNFYSVIFGWKVEDSGMMDFDYYLAESDGDQVAGLMVMPDDVANMPPFWLIYFAVDDADNFVAGAKAAGASVHRAPEDIPGTGRFAILADPQGSAFGILQTDMSTMLEADCVKAEAGQGAFNQNKPGHGNWNELMSTDPKAGFTFYSKMFGWTKGEAMDMGDMGSYQLFRHNDVDIGGMMTLGEAPVSNWLPYFGVGGSVSDKIEAIKAAGGKVHHGPMEVPGGVYIAVAQDPQGAWFAVVGASK